MNARRLGGRVSQSSDTLSPDGLLTDDMPLGIMTGEEDEEGWTETTSQLTSLTTSTTDQAGTDDHC